MMKKSINKVLLLLVIINMIIFVIPGSKVEAAGRWVTIGTRTIIHRYHGGSIKGKAATIRLIREQSGRYNVQLGFANSMQAEKPDIPGELWYSPLFPYENDQIISNKTLRATCNGATSTLNQTTNIPGTQGVSGYFDFTIEIQEYIENNIPTTPSNITVPTTIKSGENIPISWAASIDSDGDSITYRLERSINGGSYTQIYSGSSRNYTDKAQSSWETVAYRVRAYDGTDYSSYRTSSIVTIINNEKPSITVIEPLTNKRVGNQDNLIISGNVRDADIGDILKIKYNLSNTKNREITLTQPKNIISNGQNQSFQGYINLGGLSSGNEVLEIYAEDNKGGTSNKINIPINVFNSLESILKSLKSYTKSGQPQILVVNTDTIIIQSTNNDNLINQIKKELKNKNVKLYFIGKDGPTRAFLESKLLR
jgi:hypothetical protein